MIIKTILCLTLTTIAATTPLLAQAATDTKPAHSAITPAHRLAEGWWKKRHERKLTAAKKTECDLLFIGDSITQGWEGAGRQAWNQFYSKRKAFNLGYGGDRTQHVLWRLDRGEMANLNPKVTVLMIGTNNTGHSMQNAQETADGIKTIIHRIHKQSPDTKILLLAIFPRGEKPDHKMRVLNNKINAIIKTYHNGKSIHYLDIAPAFLKKDGTLSRQVMPDLLHLNQGSYHSWAKAIEPTLQKLLKN